VSLESRGSYEYLDTREEYRNLSQIRHYRLWRWLWRLSFSVTYHVF
jgi:hypothetical protein